MLHLYPLFTKNIKMRMAFCTFNIAESQLSDQASILCTRIEGERCVALKKASFRICFSGNFGSNFDFIAIQV